MLKATSCLISDAGLLRAWRSSVWSSECLHLTLMNAPSADLLSQGFQTHASKPVALERDAWAGDEGAAAGGTESQVARSLLELPAGSQAWTLLFTHQPARLWRKLGLGQESQG